MLWVEIENHLNNNILCGIMYMHPNSNIDIFLNNVYSVIDIIHQEKKLCVMSGDFNLSILNYENHPPTEDFINTLNSCFLELHIIVIVNTNLTEIN